MRRRPRFDIEITFEPAYAPASGRMYVARLYQSGARNLVWLIETGATGEEALEAMLANVRRWDNNAPPYPRTVTVDDHGEIIQ